MTTELEAPREADLESLWGRYDWAYRDFEWASDRVPHSDLVRTYREKVLAARSAIAAAVRAGCETDIAHEVAQRREWRRMARQHEAERDAARAEVERLRAALAEIGGMDDMPYRVGRMKSLALAALSAEVKP